MQGLHLIMKAKISKERWARGSPCTVYVPLVGTYTVVGS